jgi:Spx/MgsR family transcriptional regulator
MSIIVYGIPNCDTVKKARAFLAERRVAYTFHDYKKQGVPQEALNRWMAEMGWERLLNRQGSTWRKLSAERQSAVHDAASAIALMTEQPSVIRRPVLEGAHSLLVGFNLDQWSELRA